ncbi:MAG TPA: TonB family protein [Myxococcales bacterium]|nr:TonB family protein [Myxococcales bacterium]
MFESIVSPKASGRSVRSIAASVTVHGILVGVAVLLGYLNARDRPVRFIDVPLRPYRPAVPAPAPSGHAPQATRQERAKPKTVPRPIVQPKEISPLVESPHPEEQPATGADMRGDAPDPEIGTEGVIGGLPAEFNEEMTPPRKIDGPDPVYTREALDGGIEGTMVVKCVVTTRGTVRNCRVLKSLAFMDLATIDALETRRYLPASLHGQPIDVDYTFLVQLKLAQ